VVLGFGFKPKQKISGPVSSGQVTIFHLATGRLSAFFRLIQMDQAKLEYVGILFKVELSGGPGVRLKDRMAD